MKYFFRISDHFNYKFSIHSGSDKFYVFSTIGQYTGCYYHLKTAGTNCLVAIEVIAGKDLVVIIKDDNMRQILHITYGLILEVRDKEGQSIFKDRIYASLDKYEDKYYNGLYDHTERHLELLGVKKK